MNKNIIIIVIILGFVASVVFLDVPMVQSVLSTRKEIQAQQEKLSERETFVNLIEVLIDKYKNNEDALKKLDFVLPENSDIPNLLVQIEAFANESGMRLENIQISAPDEKSSSKAEAVRSGETDTVQTKAPYEYKSVNITLSMSGDYNSLKKFLQTVEENMRIVDIDSINLSDKSNETAPIFNFNISLKTYYYAN